VDPIRTLALGKTDEEEYLFVHGQCQLLCFPPGCRRTMYAIVDIPKFNTYLVTELRRNGVEVETHQVQPKHAPTNNTENLTTLDGMDCKTIFENTSCKNPKVAFSWKQWGTTTGTRKRRKGEPMDNRTCAGNANDAPALTPITLCGDGLSFSGDGLSFSSNGLSFSGKNSYGSMEVIGVQPINSDAHTGTEIIGQCDVHLVDETTVKDFRSNVDTNPVSNTPSPSLGTLPIVGDQDHVCERQRATNGSPTGLNYWYCAQLQMQPSVVSVTDHTVGPKQNNPITCIHTSTSPTPIPIPIPIPIAGPCPQNEYGNPYSDNDEWENPLEASLSLLGRFDPDVTTISDNWV